MRLARLHVPLILAATAVALAAGPATPASAAPTEPDATFLKTTHQSNLAELAAGRDAQRNASSACVRSAAAVLIRDHRRLEAQAAPVVAAQKVVLPTQPTEAQQRALTVIRERAGTVRYDVAWLAAQDELHRQYLDLIDRELATGKVDSVKSLARGARPVVLMHLDMVRDGKCHIRATPTRVNAGGGGQAARALRLRELGAIGLLGVGVVLLLTGFTAAVLRRRGSVGAG